MICLDVNAHQLVSSRSVDEMETHPEQYSPFMECDESFGDHCVRMRRQFQRGGMVQLQAIQEVSKRVSRVYTSNEPQHRQLYTNYSPQRSTPVGDCVEILYDYHGSHYWYIQKDTASLAAQRYDRRSMSSALDIWQTLWGRQIYQTALRERLIYTHQAATHYWVRSVLTDSTRRWRQSLSDGRCRHLRWQVMIFSAAANCSELERR